MAVLYHQKDFVDYRTKGEQNNETLLDMHYEFNGKRVLRTKRRGLPDDEILLKLRKSAGDSPEWARVSHAHWMERRVKKDN